MPDQTLSLCLITRDNGATLARCLKSARPAVQEIVIADLGSGDKTAAIARQHGAKLLDARGQDRAAARNLTLQAATGGWVLALDANEELPPSSVKPLRQNLIPWQEDGQLLVYFGRYLFLPAGTRPGREPAPALFAKITAFPRHPAFCYREPVFEYLSFEEAAGQVSHLQVPEITVHHYLPTEAEQREMSAREQERLRQAVQQDPADMYLRYQQIRVLCSAGDHAAALREAYDLLAENYPQRRMNPLNLAFVSYYAAQSAWQLGRVDAAADLAMNGIWMQYTIAGLWQLLALAHRAARARSAVIERIERGLQVDDARRWLDGQPVDLNQSHWGAFNLLGHLAVLDGDFAAARRCFGQAAALAPGFAAPFIGQLETAIFAEDTDEALRLVRERGAAFPQFREILVALRGRLEQFKRLPRRVAVDREAQLRPMIQLTTRMKEDWTA